MTQCRITLTEASSLKGGGTFNELSSPSQERHVQMQTSPLRQGGKEISVQPGRASRQPALIHVALDRVTAGTSQFVIDLDYPTGHLPPVQLAHFSEPDEFAIVATRDPGLVGGLETGEHLASHPPEVGEKEVKGCVRAVFE